MKSPHATVRSAVRQGVIAAGILAASAGSAHASPQVVDSTRARSSVRIERLASNQFEPIQNHSENQRIGISPLTIGEHVGPAQTTNAHRGPSAAGSAAGSAAVADAGLVAAKAFLATLGIADLPAIVIVSTAQFPHVHLNAVEAFRLSYDGVMDPVIYVLNTNWKLVKARAGDKMAIVLLAATIIHEVTHGHGGDERAAITAQIGILDRVIGSTELTPEMRHVLVDQRFQYRQQIAALPPV